MPSLTIWEFSERYLKPAAEGIVRDIVAEYEARELRAWAVTFGRGAVAMWDGPKPRITAREIINTALRNIKPQDNSWMLE